MPSGITCCSRSIFILKWYHNTCCFLCKETHFLAYALSSRYAVTPWLFLRQTSISSSYLPRSEKKVHNIRARSREYTENVYTSNSFSQYEHFQFVSLHFCACTTCTFPPTFSVVYKFIVAFAVAAAARTFRETAIHFTTKFTNCNRVTRGWGEKQWKNDCSRRSRCTKCNRFFFIFTLQLKGKKIFSDTTQVIPIVSFWQCARGSNYWIECFNRPTGTHRKGNSCTLTSCQTASQKPMQSVWSPPSRPHRLR